MEAAQRVPKASVVDVILRVALRVCLLGSATGIDLKAVGVHFAHRRRAPTSATVRRRYEKSWQRVWAVLAWEHVYVVKSMCA